MGYDGFASYEPIPFKGYQMFTLADITRIQKDSKFEPKYDLREGIKKIIEGMSDT